MSAMVEARGVVKEFGSTPVLRGVDLEVGRGDTTAIIGPSGSGKSTFLRCVNHLETIDAGTLKIEGEFLGYRKAGNTLHEMRPREVCRQRAEIGMVFQRFNLFANMTALDNVARPQMIVHRRKRDEAEHRASEFLERVGLGGKERHYPSQLSGGQQQRVAIARALAMDPKVLLFDEPTSALDPELVGEVLNVMRELATTGYTSIVVTHEIGFAREACDTVVFMDDGVVVESGPPDQVLVDPRHDRTRMFLSRLL
ncbi:amino acid ABC transporter ATP-binding protein [Nocardioides hungaricus]